MRERGGTCHIHTCVASTSVTCTSASHTKKRFSPHPHTPLHTRTPSHPQACGQRAQAVVAEVQVGEVAGVRGQAVGGQRPRTQAAACAYVCVPQVCVIVCVC